MYSLRRALLGCMVGACVLCPPSWGQSPPVPATDVLRQLNDRYKELTESLDPRLPPIIAGGAGVGAPVEQLQILVSQLRIKDTQLKRKAAAAQEDEQNVAVLLEQNRALGVTLREQQQLIASLQEQLKVFQPKAEGPLAPEPPKEPTQP